MTTPARTTRRTAAALALALAALACGRDTKVPRVDRDSAAGVIDQAGARVATGVAALLSDENVYALLDTAFAALAQEDSLAQTKTADDSIRTFAAHSISQNSLAARGVRTVAERLHVARVFPDKKIIDDHAATMQTLTSKSGRDFDTAYLDRVIDTRKTLIHEIGQALSGDNLKVPEVKKFLQEVRLDMEADRTAAEGLKGKVK